MPARSKICTCTKRSFFSYQFWQWQAIIRRHRFICIYSNELSLHPFILPSFGFFSFVLDRLGGQKGILIGIHPHFSQAIRREKGASIIYISNQEPCKTGFHKTAFSSFLTSIRQISESNCQMWETLYAAVYLQSGTTVCEWEDRTELFWFFEECNSITVPLQITGGTGVSCALAAGAHWVTLTQMFQSHGKRVEPSSVSSRRDPTQKDTIDSSHTETDYLLLSFLFNNSSKANYG